MDNHRPVQRHPRHRHRDVLTKTSSLLCMDETFRSQTNITHTSCHDNNPQMVAQNPQAETISILFVFESCNKGSKIKKSPNLFRASERRSTLLTTPPRAHPFLALARY